MALYETGMRTADRIEPVVLQKVLADRANQGYHDVQSALVTKVEGEPIRDLQDLVTRVDAATGDFVRFELSDQREIVLDRFLALKRHKFILKRYGVPEDRSADLIVTTPQSGEERLPGSGEEAIPSSG